MAEQKEYYPIRISFRSRDEYENFRRLETVMVVRGRDMADFWARVIESALMQYDNLGGKKVIGAEELRFEVKRCFGIEINRHQLLTLRVDVLVEGKDYWGAPNGEKREYRYDLDRCLPKIGEWIGGK